MRIDINVREKIAELADPDAYFICGNSDIIVHFDLDEEWNGYDVKTARFTFENGYIDKVFEGDELEAPIISNSQYVKIGVFAGNLHTSTPAFIRAKKSILCDSGQPAAPEDDVYAQIMKKMNELGKNTSGIGKVNLPQDEEGEYINGAVGQFAVSDGTGGITWLTVVDGNEVAW